MENRGDPMVFFIPQSYLWEISGGCGPGTQEKLGSLLVPPAILPVNPASPVLRERETGEFSLKQRG